MQRIRARVHYVGGLHLRPSAEVVRCAQQFSSRITLSYQRKKADACSLLQVLCLGAGFGADVEIRASGPDERDAVRSIEELFCDGAGI